MFAAVAAALVAALLSLGGASLVIADQPLGNGVDNHASNGNGNGNANGQAQAPPAAQPVETQTAPAASHGKGKSQSHSGAAQQPKHQAKARAPKQQTTAAAPTGGGSHSTATSGPGNSAQGCDGTHHSDTGHGANQGGPYDNTCDGSPSGNGNGNGKATGKPCAGCVGNADDKNPKGQMPNGSDHNVGYECDRNHGIGRSNPAHTGCAQGEQAPPSTQPGGENQGESPCPKFTSALSQAAVVALKAVAAAHPEVAKLAKFAEMKAFSKCGATAGEQSNGAPKGKITICHATGSATNPYVEITISVNGLNGHGDHQDDRDIIPAPADGCPAGQAQNGQLPGGGTTQDQRVTKEGQPVTQAEQPAATVAPEATAAPAMPEAPGRQAVLGERIHGTTAPASTPQQVVLGERASGTTPAAAVAPAAAQRAVGAGDEGRSLPFTGTDAILVLFLGCLMLLGGFAIQRVLARD
ncbi:MAG TPA: hypothetical protein VH247_02880 [Thermoleophilaceae bacterium]|nr:hypothetical protein [Thermoleophilaceae bacterium]